MTCWGGSPQHQTAELSLVLCADDVTTGGLFIQPDPGIAEVSLNCSFMCVCCIQLIEQRMVFIRSSEHVLLVFLALLAVEEGLLKVFTALACLGCLPLKVLSKRVRSLVITPQSICPLGTFWIKPESDKQSGLHNLFIPKQQVTSFIKCQNEVLQKDQLRKVIESSIFSYAFYI